ncbi:MAG: hypothetical protein K1X53_00990 [Candidatus Sumerlaeaceae bacterium]|nr:hypothetical protein [Candidatus Sumerlaeaceae bacterium]
MKLLLESLGKWRTCALAAVAGTMVLALPSAGRAQPANDLFNDALTLSGASGTTITSNIDATTETAEPPIAGVDGGASVWYSWTAPADGCATFRVSNATFDSLLAVSTGTLSGGLTSIAENNDDGSTDTSRVTFNALSGETYSIAVDGVAGTSGTASLTWFMGAPGAPSGPSPFNGETTSVNVTVLDWADVPGTTTYTVILNSNVVGVTTQSLLVLPVSINIGNNLWQVSAENECGITFGPPWFFTYCPTGIGVPDNPVPPTGSTVPSTIPKLDWDDTTNVVIYDVYLNGSLYASVIASEVNLLTPPPFGYNEWQVIGLNSCGYTTGSLWNFCVIDPPKNPVPSDGGTVCDPPIILDWDDQPAATGYDVVYDGIPRGTVTSSQYTLPSTPSFGFHSWQITVRNSCSTAPGPVWTFNVSTGGSPSQQAWRTNGQVHAVAVDGGRVYLGGNFTQLVSPGTSGTLSRNNLAALDAATGLPLPWTANTDGPVYALTSGNNTIYAGGDFTQVQGISRANIAAIGTNGFLVSSWNPGANGIVRTLTTSTTNLLYAGGQFTTLAGTGRSRAGAVDLGTGALSGWNPNADQTVYTLVEHSGEIYAGGSFNSIGGQTRKGIARLDPTIGNATVGWNANCNLYVYAIAFSTTTDTLYVGGQFTSIGGQTRNNLAELRIGNATATSWNPFSNATVYALAQVGNTLFVGGEFSLIGGLTRSYLAGVDVVTGLAVSCQFAPDNVVRALVPMGPTFLAGGDFVFLGGSQNQGFGFFGSTSAPSTGAVSWDLYR